jgi:hypothetical protein
MFVCRAVYLFVVITLGGVGTSSAFCSTGGSIATTITTSSRTALALSSSSSPPSRINYLPDDILGGMEAHRSKVARQFQALQDKQNNMERTTTTTTTATTETVSETTKSVAAASTVASPPPSPVEMTTSVKVPSQPVYEHNYESVASGDSSSSSTSNIPTETWTKPCTTTLQGSGTLFERRNEFLVQTAVAGKTRWGIMEVEKAKMYNGLQGALKILQGGSSSSSSSSTGTLFERRNEYVKQAAAAGKSRWGIMEVEKAKTYNDLQGALEMLVASK